jgi:hypothetical protein
MNTEALHRRLSPAEYAALRDAARSEAVRLRNLAIATAWDALVRRLRRASAVLVTPPPASRQSSGVARSGAPAR